VTGSKITARPSSKTGSRSYKNLVVTVNGLKSEYENDLSPTVRLSIFDQTSPLIKVVKVPSVLQGSVFRKVHYQIRDHVTGDVLIPFDETKNSTKVSSDSEGMFFKFDAGSLELGKSYIFDIMVEVDGTKEKYMNASSVFRIVKAS